MKNIKRQKYGFSLMEMMVVLLIISIIMAATAPMVAKKMATDRANGGSPWIFTSNNGNIGFNIAGNNVSAIIGASEISGRPNGITPRLIINGSNTQPALAFASGSAYVGQLTVDGANNAVGISNDYITNGTVALGLEQSIGNTNTIAIGNGITTTNNGEINIGDKFRYDGSENITLGNNSDVVNIPGSLRLNGLTATNSELYMQYYDDNSRGGRRLVVFSDDNNGTVHIKGNLVVDGKTMLGTQPGSHTYLRPYNDTNTISNHGENSKNKTHTNEITSIVVDDYKGSDDNTYKFSRIDITSNFKVNSNGTFILSSDRRLKNIDAKYTLGMEQLKKLDIYNFTFKHDKTKSPHVGVMAQDLEKVFPNSVSIDQTGYLRIRWDEMFYAVINAIKELDTKITELVSKVTDNTDEIQALKKEIKELKAQNAEYVKQNVEIEKNNKQLAKQCSDIEKRLLKLENNK
jgi:prepilin-type N-terminal cleavage/methylation domain-containing protein